jgi:hypothetical protein
MALIKLKCSENICSDLRFTNIVSEITVTILLVDDRKQIPKVAHCLL